MICKLYKKKSNHTINIAAFVVPVSDVSSLNKRNAELTPELSLSSYIYGCVRGDIMLLPELWLAVELTGDVVHRLPLSFRQAEDLQQRDSKRENSTGRHCTSSLKGLPHEIDFKISKFQNGFINFFAIIKC